MRTLYEATHRGSYSQGMVRNTVRQVEFNTFSTPPVSNRDRTMPDMQALKSIDYFETKQN